MIANQTQGFEHTFKHQLVVTIIQANSVDLFAFGGQFLHILHPILTFKPFFSEIDYSKIKLVGLISSLGHKILRGAPQCTSLQ